MTKRRQLSHKHVTRPGRRDLKPQWEPVPEWAPESGDDDYTEPIEGEEPEEYGVHVRPLASWERRQFRQNVANAQKRMPDVEEPEFSVEMLLVWGVCDEEGKPLLTMGDLKALSQRSNAPIQRLAQRILHLSGMTEASQKEMEKNSETTPRSSFGSNSDTDTESPTTAGLNGLSHPAGLPS